MKASSSQNKMKQVFKRMGIGDSTISNSEIRLIRWCFNMFCEKTHGKSHPVAVVAYALCLASQDEERQRPLCDTIASPHRCHGVKIPWFQSPSTSHL
jgi:hypothetical protein